MGRFYLFIELYIFSLFSLSYFIVLEIEVLYTVLEEIKMYRSNSNTKIFLYIHYIYVAIDEQINSLKLFNYKPACILI